MHASLYNPPLPIPALLVPAGQLLAAYLSYLLSTSAQSQLPLLGFAPLSSDVLTYTVQRVLPLLLVDTRYPAWYFEGSGGSA